MNSVDQFLQRFLIKKTINFLNVPLYLTLFGDNLPRERQMLENEEYASSILYINIFFCCLGCPEVKPPKQYV